MAGEKRSETVSFRLPLSTAQRLTLLSEVLQVSRGKVLCRLIEKEALSRPRPKHQPERKKC